MRKAINISLAFLAIHLFTVHSKLIYHLNPDKFKDNIFSFIHLTDEATIISLIVSITYSIITVTLIKALKHWNYYIISICIFAFLDGAAMTIYYLVPDKYEIFGSVYYGIYTLYIIVCIGISERNKILNKNENIESKLNTLKEFGYSVSDISRKTGLSIKSINKILESKNGKYFK